MEIFKTIDGYDNYKISNYGNVINDNTNKLLKSVPNSQGYHQVFLCKNGKQTAFKIHRLVGLNFCENENNYNIVDHINRDKNNNCYDNLRWVTRSQNNRNSTKSKNTSSKYIGVSLNTRNKKWVSQITIEYCLYKLGSYDTEEEAYEAFKKAVVHFNLVDYYHNL